MLTLSLTAAVAADAPPALTVTAPGAEPRRLLSVAPPVGQRERAVLRLRLNATTVTQGNELPSAKLPVLEIGLRTEVLSTSDDGLRYRITVDGVTVAGDPAEADLQAALTEVLSPLKGWSATAAVRPTGQPLTVSWDELAGADPQLVDEIRRCIDFVQTLRPQTPVGAGAGWTLQRTDHDAGFVVDVTEQWSVQDLGEVWVLRSQVRHHAAPQPIRDADLPEGRTARLLKHLAVGEGEVRLDPGHVLPERALLGLTTRSRVLFVADGVEVDSTTTTGVEVEVIRQP